MGARQKKEIEADPETVKLIKIKKAQQRMAEQEERRRLMQEESERRRLQRLREKQEPIRTFATAQELKKISDGKKKKNCFLGVSIFIFQKKKTPHPRCFFYFFFFLKIII
ncbi:hypothetical protein DDB_G0295815 [Dictyostelium discoideum AX4]|uniref:Uncharacterized protein n=1 Tax=Dictyostelium discoideum TaxID=44689 RepID=C7G066_DICDI|nr:hypothetical protein DDB_G0295815 [Dictyostelium discoideum AX4]EEU04056.1 hypothetical protein DDB_G0295815 [Dictyostelium discoideum AX4]|eukprot:XP_002649108.1 hypothetical protein DDB_G0295815 [Dictyostelium discoideum AX4]